MSLLLQNLINELETQRMELKSYLSNVDQKLFLKNPVSGSWSISEVIQHLVLADIEVEKQITEKIVQNDSKRSIRDKIGLKIVRGAFIYGLRVKVPLKSVIPLNKYSYEEVFTNWEAIRVKMNNTISEINDEQLNINVFRHPIAGKLNIKQTLELIKLHINHHIGQIKRIEKKLGI